LRLPPKLAKIVIFMPSSEDIMVVSVLSAVCYYLK
jgi:hypothetical protein